MARMNHIKDRVRANSFGIVDPTDQTKTLVFDASNLTTGTTRTLVLAPVHAGTAGTGTSAVETGDGCFKQVVLTLTAVSVSVSDTNVGGGTLIYTFPEGDILILGATATLTPTTTTAIASTLNASKTISTGVGTVQTTTQASGTLATTEQDIVGQFSTTSSATINVAGTGGNGRSGVTTDLVRVDGTSTAAKAYINLGIPTATDIDGDATVTVSGTVTISYVWSGDY